MQKVMETENRQIHSLYDMIFMLGGLWAALFFSISKNDKSDLKYSPLVPHCFGNFSMV